MMMREYTKSRYCYNTAVYGRVGRRVTLRTMFRRWLKNRLAEKPDLYPVTGYYPAIYPEK